VSCRFVVNQTAKGFLEVSVLACRCINTNLSRFRCDMTRDIIAHMQNALAAVVCLLFMLDTAENTINERNHGLSINGCPSAVIRPADCQPKRPPVPYLAASL